jgi:hypothetical protein
MDKKKCADVRQEKGIIARIIMSKLGRTPMTYLLDYALSLCVLIFMFWISPNYDTKRDMFFIFIGVYMMILWMNSYHIIQAKRNWNNAEYWKLERRRNLIKK